MNSHGILGVTVAVVLMTANTAVFAAQSGAKPSSSTAQDDAVALARTTLAKTLPVAANELRVINVSAAEWRDTSLGCPSRGQAYNPVISSGFKVTLRESDRDYVVHVSGSRAVVCDSGPDPRLSSAPLLAASMKAGDAVRQALSARLEVDRSRVSIVSTRPWRPGQAGCAAAPPTAAGLAHIVEARVGATTYRYYTDGSVTVSCENK